MLSLLSGLVAGSIHVVSGPDHLAAVAPLSVRHPKHARSMGFKWGLGHAGGVIFVGLLALLLRRALPVEAFSSWSERIVGMALGAIGLWGIRAALKNRVHVHEHSHGGNTHMHLHVHSPQQAHAETSAHSHTHTAFAFGILHGFAGSSHFIGVLPALAFPTTIDATLYLGAYGIGTVLAMTCFASVMGATAKRFALSGEVAYRRLMLSCSTAAILVGAYWLVS
ncbi:MAG: ABC-type nickel/cobalt efflux system permease component RcnA [Verrucomicrobiales bacterium]|nr:ABC-type nickel/cobalt efflux system permease component RcnA [Verrucomicrobiales bacterium]